MEKLKFKVTVHKKLQIELSLETMRKYPVHTHSLVEIKEFIVVYTYKPALTLNKIEYVEILIKSLRLKYNNSNSNCTVDFLKI